MALLDVRNLKVHYLTQSGVVKAVDNISFSIEKGEFVGLAGESGCGKSTAGYSILRLVPPPGRIVDGEICFDGKDILNMSEEMLRNIRWKRIPMIFQAAMNALNPILSCEEQITDCIMLHDKVSKGEARRRARSLFELVGLKNERLRDFPFAYSGGMRQRAMISLALSCNPDLVIADEPTTALDVTIQAQVLDLLKKLRNEFHMAVLLITHDISIIAETCEKVIVMYAGKIVETGDTESVLTRPLHPYTKGLIEAIPSIEKGKSRLFSISGEPPNLLSPPRGCRFHPRCPYAKDICRQEEPPLMAIKKSKAACHFADVMENLPGSELWKDYG